WLTKVVIDADAGDLDFDLAIDASGAGNPSPIDAGYAPFTENPAPRPPVAMYVLLAALIIVLVPVGLARFGHGGPMAGPPAAAT
ncbi:MAG TPA: hypothetical protein VFN76_03695, partial [Candidatus Limnocylindria bacterium]|nr:hypothetical protein [Candidatus Limnocylindria bacterium]